MRSRDVALGTVLVMLVLLLFGLLLSIRYVLVAIFLGVLLATALRSSVTWLRDRGVARWLAAAIIMLLLIALVVGGTIALIPSLVSQTITLTGALPNLYTNTRDTLLDSSYRIIRQFGYSLPPALNTNDQGTSEAALVLVIEWLPEIGYGLFGTINTLLLTYFWLLYRERSLHGMLLMLPMRYRENGETIWLQIEDRIGAFLRGQMLLGGLIGLLSLVGYWLIGMPYALLLALIAAIMELVPFIGPIITTIIATAAGFSISLELGMYALVIGIVTQQVENMFLAPRIMDKAVGVNPVITLLSFVGFAALFGIGGGLLAIPMAAVLQVLFEFWIASRDRMIDETNVQGRSLLDRLRYQIQDLSQDVALHLRAKDDEVTPAADKSEEDLEDLLLSLDGMLHEIDTVRISNPNGHSS